MRLATIPGLLLAGALLLAWPVADGSAASASTAGPSAAGTSATRTAAASHITTITLNGAKRGPEFQGIGAISGGGGNSRLLIDYPPASQRQILDYLFKPDYGASLQILKLEIGGDDNSSDGAEPSIEHSPGHIDCAAGYEFWLAEQARSIDPAIKLYGLQWGAPGWVGAGQQTIWTTADIHYVIDWLNCARADGLTINYLGGWNEHGDGSGSGGVAWFEALRTALDAAGYTNVQIVAADSVAGLAGADIANHLVKDPAFSAAVDVVGYHDSCQYPTTGLRCAVPAAARSLGKPVWQSEIGAMDSNSGAPAMARSINNSYLQAGVSALLEWPLIDSMPPDLPMEYRGLIWADQPWSGNYQVNKMTWTIAQTTQFVQPGWQHINDANAVLGSPGWGSYNSYESPDHSTWSMVAQTTSAPASQTVIVHLSGGLATSTVHVWRTNLRSASPATWFRRAASAHPVGGAFSYRLLPGYLYTFTTGSGQAKGENAAPPGPAPMPLPYIARPDASNEPWALAPQDGAFEYAPDGTTIEQTAVGTPVLWHLALGRYPYAVLGGSTWRDYTVSAQVRFTAAGQGAGLIARYSQQTKLRAPQQFDGYHLTVSETGSWLLTEERGIKPAVQLAAGLVAPLGVGAWHSLTLTASGKNLIASLDGQHLATARSSGYGQGLAGISTAGWYQVNFRDLTVTGLAVTEAALLTRVTCGG